MGRELDTGQGAEPQPMGEGGSSLLGDPPVYGASNSQGN